MHAHRSLAIGRNLIENLERNAILSKTCNFAQEINSIPVKNSNFLSDSNAQNTIHLMREVGIFYLYSLTNLKLDFLVKSIHVSKISLMIGVPLYSKHSFSQANRVSPYAHRTQYTPIATTHVHQYQAKS